MNYLKLIKEEFINKKSEFIVCIPTYQSYEITKKTISRFLLQKKVIFDLLVTGPSGDIEKLYKDFPFINFVLTKDNYGSSGNQLINIAVALKYDYKYIVLNDNDAFFISSNGLFRLLSLLKSNSVMAVRGKNYDEKVEKIKPYYNKEIFCAFHGVIYKTEVFKNIELPNFNYFLIHDDIALSCNYLEKYKIITNPKVAYYHPHKLSHYKFTNLSKFLYLRSTLIGLIFERKNFYTLKYFSIFSLGLVIPFISSLIKLDFSYFKILSLVAYQILTKKFFIPILPKDRFIYQQIGVLDNLTENFYPSILDRIIEPKFIFLTDRFYNKVYIYQKRKIS